MSDDKQRNAYQEFTNFENNQSEQEGSSVAEDETIRDTEPSRPRVDIDEPKTKKRRKFSTDLTRPWRYAGILVLGIVLILAIIGLIASIGFIRNHFNTMSTPQKAGETLIHTIAADDYDKYQTLWSQEEFTRQDAELFQTLQGSINLAEDAMVSNFILLRLESGKQYLCSIFYDKDAKQYKIRSINEVPTDTFGLFGAQ